MTSEEELNKIFLEFKTDKKNGLTIREAKLRLKFYGKNDLVQKAKYAILVQFFSQFLNPLILILLFASLVSAFLGELTNFIIIFVIIIVSAGIDFYQQYQAESAADKLKKKVLLTATVIRDGEKREIPFLDIVPGDIVFLTSGDLIPADSRLFEVNNLSVDQSSLTGESYPVEKHINENVYMGTHVVSGEAYMVVFSTGSKTEFGKIAQKLVERRPQTEFNLGLNKFSYVLIKAILLLTIFVFFINALVRHDVLNSFLFAVALAVGLTPELLPMIITVNLAKGALRMSKKGVIVKDLPAIQNFGTMNILCTDKTGTLTNGEITFNHTQNPSGVEDDLILLYGFLNSFYATNFKSPMDKAIISSFKGNHNNYQKIMEIPFDFYRKKSSIVVDKDKQRILITKGAFEEVINYCTHYSIKNDSQILTKEKKKEIEERFKDLSVKGWRVLALAKKIIEKKSYYSHKDEKDEIFLGFLIFSDMPKSSAKEALSLLHTQGIEVKILSGDNEMVTKHICFEVGIDSEKILTGEEVDRMSQHELVHKAYKTKIFTKLTPENKRRIILALKKHNEVVGFLGDGINDAPSLRAADIGISVDNATDVAKEAADLIILRKDLHILNTGVIEGRVIQGNAMKYLLMETSSNFGNMFSVAFASLFLSFLPMLPIQILLNNLLYDFSQLSIPGDSVDKSYIKMPKRWNIDFIKHFMLVFGPISSLFDFLTFFILFLFFKASPALFQTGWFLESLATQTLVIFAIRTNLVPFYKSKPSKLVLFSAILIVSIGLIIPITPFGNIFSFVAPPKIFYLILLFIVAFYFLVVEWVKKWFYKKYSL